MITTQQSLKRIESVVSRFGNGFTIGAPVGDWNKGAKNDPNDVKTVQLMLEHAARVSKNKLFDPKGIDGEISRQAEHSRTVRAIRGFQGTFMKSPDGLVDPNGQTIQRLRDLAVGKEKKSQEASQSVMKIPSPGEGFVAWLFGFNGSDFSGSTATSLLPAPSSAEPKWISIAEKELGTEELKEKGQHNGRIVEYHKSTTLKANERHTITDEDPWCASFVNWVLKKAGYEGTNSAWSHSYKKWGDGLAKPAVGAVAFIDWGKVDPKKDGKGHVGFVVGKTAGGRIVLLGGNQSDTVRYTAFKKSHIAAYRVPKGYKVEPSLYDLPEMKISGDGSGFESTR